MRISDLSTMEVQVEVTENDILKVALGDNTEIEVDAYLDKIFTGRVTEIANSATNVAGTTSATAALNTDQVTNFIVKIRINRESYTDMITSGSVSAFRPGMSASVDIITETKDDVLVVPIQSVGMRVIDEDADDTEFKEVVFIYEGDTARLVPVSTGIQDDEYIHILSGIPEEAEVISGPYTAISKELESGSAVSLKDEDKDEDKG